MEIENPMHLNCPYCPAKAFPRGPVIATMQGYVCPDDHWFYAKAEDTSFDYGFNKENK